MESAIERELDRAVGAGGPPRLSEALRYALFPGGGRVRPRLVIEVAAALGDESPDLADRAAVALELLHCASLVHDDMPVFDDAETRRGKPALHRVYGEQIALLAGDALIAMAFEVVGRADPADAGKVPGIIAILGEAVGASRGIIAGQAWESEESVDMDEYHRAKTAALFEAAAMAGAVAAGRAPGPWREMGRLIGQAYQVADDIADSVGTEEELGKPVGQDESNDRPSAVRRLGLAGAVSRLDALVDGAVAAIPDSPRRDRLAALVSGLALRLCPEGIRARASSHRGPGAAVATAATA